MRLLLTSAALALAACQTLPRPQPGTTQYVCPNGQTVRVSPGSDEHLLKLGIRGRVHTLTWLPEVGVYDNGFYRVRLEDTTLQLETAGTLLPQHCLRQAPATGN